jgi:hypothetical protein
MWLANKVDDGTYPRRPGRNTGGHLQRWSESESEPAPPGGEQRPDEGTLGALRQGAIEVQPRSVLVVAP